MLGFDCQLDAGLHGSRARGLDTRAQELVQAHRLELDRELPGVRLGDEQQVSHQSKLAPRVALDDLEEAAGLRVELDTAAQRQLHVPEDRGERRSQLV
jgi:hypothetical protein